MKTLFAGKYFLSVPLLFYCCMVNAQITFNKTYDFNNGDEGALSIVKVDDGCILVGNGWGNETAD